MFLIFLQFDICIFCCCLIFLFFLFLLFDICMQNNVDGPKSLLYYPAGAPGSQPQSIVNVSGAGDW